MVAIAPCNSSAIVVNPTAAQEEASLHFLECRDASFTWLIQDDGLIAAAESGNVRAES